MPQCAEVRCEIGCAPYLSTFGPLLGREVSARTCSARSLMCRCRHRCRDRRMPANARASFIPSLPFAIVARETSPCLAIALAHQRRREGLARTH